VARLANGAIAGGTRRLVDVVRRVVTYAGVSLLDAVTAASATPASLFGLADVTGSLVAGLHADVLVVDDALTPVRVMRAGQWLPLS
jgi:N-acetylglucosamine-6-phosphate deacetylase